MNLFLHSMIIIMYQLIHLCSKSSLVAAQCEFTTDADNRHGFCTLDQFCCKGFSVNNLCSTGGVCCYGSYDCSSGSNPSVHQTYSPCPEIITRQRWRARDASNVVPSIGPAEHVFIHHTDDGNTCFSEDTCGVRIRSLQSYHQLNKGWTDIAWNFLIGGNGQVFEGLGWTREGFHTLDWNRESIGVAFVGNFNDEKPSAEMLTALESLIACGVRSGHIRGHYRIHGHRDVRRQTSCPGEYLYRYINKLDRFQAGPLAPPNNRHHL